MDVQYLYSFLLSLGLSLVFIPLLIRYSAEVGLLDDPAEAWRLGEGARRAARERFNIERFARDWEETFADVIGARSAASRRGTAGAAALEQVGGVL